MKEAIIEDEELGRLIVRVNLRAKSLVFRTKSDAVYVSVPSGTTMKSRMFGAPPKRLSIFSAQRVWISQQA